ncbi:methyltransferase domain-containing protein [Embleya sp. NBC_00896]|uniref:methyltransferase domain-containing protein n=1 Tax=Embleya sp. NBC_00896 TaxID=2975961 RepID=UPI00386558D1|nr:methyltransferase [Embleya sp. NBC_00896]
MTGPLPGPWREAFERVPRSAFLPDVVWVRLVDGMPDHAPVDRAVDPDGWEEIAWSDVPAVIQVRDGREPEPGEPAWPSSSVSQPSIVASTLLTLDVMDGHRVLEIGTGGGWNAGLLARRLGGANVVTVEVDPVLAAAARGRLDALGLRPTVVAGDGAKGWAERAPYDRILGTCSVARVPRAWLEQSAPGGLIVTPWTTAWATYGNLVLTPRQDGTARGRFVHGGSFMSMRGHRSRIRDVAAVVRPTDVPDTSTTTLSPWDVAGGDRHAEAVMGLVLPGLRTHWNDDPGTGDDFRSRLWIWDDALTSWATVDYDGQQLETFRVRQHGPRRLWDEVAAAWTWWTSAGRPAFDRFGLDIDPDGTQTIRYDEPDGPSWLIPLDK